ncbi:Cholestenol Delta-isomerase [Apiospora rasikravindrae]|uniref:gamma-glutamylcyclotransferase n=1 Tax=Apiospora rasikravindrae TaxID=990691 RepID=A0ABR1TD55_9PEZI
MSATQNPQRKLYFAYGSNLAFTQMRKRCPTAYPIGLGHLRGWTWIINERGFANIVKDDPAPTTASSDTVAATKSDNNSTLTGAAGDEQAAENEQAAKPYHDLTVSQASAPTGVYGVLYALLPADEEQLDTYEGVPTAYEKATLDVEVVKGSTSHSISYNEYCRFDGHLLPTLVYIDRHRVSADWPRPEYVERMNRGIAEARRDWDFPDDYVDQVMRNFIPEKTS